MRFSAGAAGQAACTGGGWLCRVCRRPDSPAVVVLTVGHSVSLEQSPLDTLKVGWPQRAFRTHSPNQVTVRPMGDSPLSAHDVRAAAEVHTELGPDYSDAVVESFLSKIDAHIAERVEQRLASMTRPTRRPIDPVQLRKQREALGAVVIGSVVAGVPLSLVAWVLIQDGGGNAAPLLLIWVVLLSVYGVAAYRLRRG
jgi:hypothetical protein